MTTVEILERQAKLIAAWINTRGNKPEILDIEPNHVLVLESSGAASYFDSKINTSLPKSSSNVNVTFKTGTFPYDATFENMQNGTSQSGTFSSDKNVKRIAVTATEVASDDTKYQVGSKIYEIITEGLVTIYGHDKTVAAFGSDLRVPGAPDPDNYYTYEGLNDAVNQCLAVVPESNTEGRKALLVAQKMLSAGAPKGGKVKGH